jgi:hypothetical protein
VVSYTWNSAGFALSWIDIDFLTVWGAPGHEKTSRGGHRRFAR